MKKIFQILFSISTTGLLLFVFAIALAAATFIETSYGTEAARAIVYNSWWMELILILLGANLVANVFKFKLYKKQKLTLGIFHLAFILILIGAAITRYIGYEGVMHIREGEASSSIVTEEPYFHFNAEFEGEKGSVESRFLISSTSKNQVNGKLSIGDKRLRIKSVDYMSQAQKKLEPDPKGVPVIEIVYPVRGGSMQSELLKSGGVINISGVSFGFDKDAQLMFSSPGDSLKMISGDTISIIDMSGGGGTVFEPGKYVKSEEKTVYKVGNAAFIIKQFLPSAKITAVSGSGGTEGEGAVIIEISDNDTKETFTAWIDTRNTGIKTEGEFRGVKYTSWIGPKEINLPFSIALKDFLLERYPGSNSPSSFESMVTLKDEEQGINKDYRIFMNNILKHRGYRFFQSSYDNDEKGTILSVNKDPWGTTITYIGYFLLFFGMIVSIFNPKSYFYRLMKKITVGAILILLILTGTNKAYSAVPKEVNAEIASDFAEVWVQGHEGRIKPFSTLAYEVIMKVTRLEKFLGQEPEQVVLGMAVNPHEWQTLPMVAINDRQLEKKLGTKADKAAFSDFFDRNGNYKFAQDIQVAYGKNPAQRNKYDNAVIKVDERLNVLYQLFNGELFRFYPSPDKKDDHWYTPTTNLTPAFSADSAFVRSSFMNLLSAVKNNNKSEAQSIISRIKDYQQRYGSELIPGETKGRLEILYNRINIFHDLSLWYILLGFILIILFFYSLFSGRALRKKAIRITYYGLLFGFLAHSLGLIIRGYISEHMPWSNGYESMIYIAWAGMLAGLIFARRNTMVFGAAAILSGLTLFVAQMSWLNPEITNLVPVLKSYWLTIHVAIITASYGFLGVSAIIGLLNLIMAAIHNESNRKRFSETIDQMTAVNQASLILGLYFLTMGTFLGGIWANESWGRYWGWDPKETWSLITIVGYTFITHMRWIPGFRGWYAINLGSIAGILLVLMTYLGVNYYLSGLHSYGSGQGLQLPVILVVVFVLIGLIAFIAKKRGDLIKHSEPVE